MPWRGVRHIRRHKAPLPRTVAAPSRAMPARAIVPPYAQRPERPAVAVLRPARFQPLPVIAHEIAEAAQVGVPAMLDEGGIGLCQLCGLLVVAPDRHHQRAGIVVDAIAMVAVGDRINRVLQHADAIGHPLDRIERQSGGRGAAGARWRRTFSRAARANARPPAATASRGRGDRQPWRAIGAARHSTAVRSPPRPRRPDRPAGRSGHDRRPISPGHGHKASR